jgi:hypothetical protein
VLQVVLGAGRVPADCSQATSTTCTCLSYHSQHAFAAGVRKKRAVAAAPNVAATLSNDDASADRGGDGGGGDGDINADADVDKEDEDDEDDDDDSSEYFGGLATDKEDRC